MAAVMPTPHPQADLLDRRGTVLPASLPPRGLCRVQAAAYVGVSPSTFDLMVKAGDMPPAKRLRGRVVWDRHALDIAFDAIPNDGEAEGGGACPGNPWDADEGMDGDADKAA